MSTVPITHLIVEEYSWPRDQLDASRVEMFVSLLKEDQSLPPIEVVAAGDGTYVIADGVHRYLAAREAGMDQVEVIIVSPSAGEHPLDCAFRRALETACRTALPLTRAERRRAVKNLLATRKDLPHREIARLVGVAHATVDRWAKEPDESANGAGAPSAARGPNVDEVAVKLVSFLERLGDSRGLFELFVPKRMGTHLGQAFYDRFGDRALAEARTVAVWINHAVATLEGSGGS